MLSYKYIYSHFLYTSKRKKVKYLPWQSHFPLSLLIDISHSLPATQETQVSGQEKLFPEETRKQHSAMFRKNGGLRPWAMQWSQTRPKPAQASVTAHHSQWNDGTSESSNFRRFLKMGIGIRMAMRLTPDKPALSRSPRSEKEM